MTITLLHHPVTHHLLGALCPDHVAEAREDAYPIEFTETPAPPGTPCERCEEDAGRDAPDPRIAAMLDDLFSPPSPRVAVRTVADPRR